ncbi:MAG: 16S rRNA (guanine966-N2)-methyltransferase [Bermanella sp.]|jgi:16S rRNA (guanine966-N2)-methyltransferase
MRKAPTNTTELGKLRIIGGQWRGRKLSFPVADGLRPTGDRIRETLFNWLAPEIEGAHCLDLFAGSGALGLEALSRGAASCTFIESNRLAADAIQQQLTILDCRRGEVVLASASEWLQSATKAFDVIFVDPPFQAGYYAQTLSLIAAQKCLAPRGSLYFECDTSNNDPIHTAFRETHDKRAGNTRYRLLECTTTSHT